MPLVDANELIVEQILDDSWELWGDGLDRANYGRYYAAQRRTAWGSRHLDRVALVEDGSVLSSLKRYHLRARLRGRTVSVLGIGAVFTAPGHRRRGAAADLITQAMDDASRQGTDAALLFSEIGPDYYGKFGFTPIEREELTIDTGEKPGAPAVLVRAAEERDIPAVTDLRRAQSANAGFALEIDADWVRYGLARKRLQAGLAPAHTRQVEFFIAEEGASAVAFVLLNASARGVVLEACGDRDPAGARVGAILQVLRARTPAESGTPIRAWLPPGFQPPQIRVIDRQPAREIMMVRPLQPGVDVATLTAADIVFPHVDAF